jgi:hypothetical protein
MPHAPPRHATRAGLEKAMEAKKRERALSKYREANGLGEQINIDLTYAVDFNLAVCFHANKDYLEANDHFTGEAAQAARAACASGGKGTCSSCGGRQRLGGGRIRARREVTEAQLMGRARCRCGGD